MVLPTKFVYVVVHPAREISSPTHNQKRFIENLDISELSWQKQKKQILRLFGSRNPFTTIEGEKVDFYGVVTFELAHEDIGGMECSNSLILNFSRLVFEAKTLRKKTFVTLEDFFAHYCLEQAPKNFNHYVPILNRKEGKIEVRTAWRTMRELDNLAQETTSTNKNEAQSGRELDLTKLIVTTEEESKFEVCSNEDNKMLPGKEPRQLSFAAMTFRRSVANKEEDGQS